MSRCFSPSWSSRPAWHRQAACRGADPALLFPERGQGHQPTEALASASGAPSSRSALPQASRWGRRLVCGVGRLAGVAGTCGRGVLRDLLRRRTALNEPDHVWSSWSGLSVGVSGSVLGLLRPAHDVPNLEVLSAMGLFLRKFGQPAS